MEEKPKFRQLFDSWIDLYTDYLFSHARLKVGNTEDAEDLVQETFLSAFKNKESFREESSVKTWLVSILKNKIIDFYRKNSKIHPFEAYIQQTEESFDNAIFNENNFGRWKEKINENYFSESADTYLLSQEFQHYLDLCINKMPLNIRSVFVAKYIDEENHEVICKDYNISASNYWVIIHRSKIILRACLEKKGITP